MLKVYFTVLAFIIGIPLIINTADGAEERKSISWMQIYGLSVPGINLFVDVNSIETNKSGGISYNTGDIMITYNVPVTKVIEGKTYIFSSVVKSVIIECSSGTSVPMYDYYFQETKPDRKSVPIIGLDYSTLDLRSKSFVVPPKVPIKMALCPNYI